MKGSLYAVIFGKVEVFQVEMNHQKSVEYVCKQNKRLSWKYNTRTIFDAFVIFSIYERKFINFRSEKMLFFRHLENNQNKP